MQLNLGIFYEIPSEDKEGGWLGLAVYKLEDMRLVGRLNLSDDSFVKVNLDLLEITIRLRKVFE